MTILDAATADDEENVERYAKARYSKHSWIAEKELAWLTDHVGQLCDAVQTICDERLSELARKDSNG